MRPCFSQAINTDSKYYILVSTTNNQTISSQLTTKAPKNLAVVQAAMHINFSYKIQTDISRILLKTVSKHQTTMSLVRLHSWADWSAHLSIVFQKQRNPVSPRHVWHYTHIYACIKTLLIEYSSLLYHIKWISRRGITNCRVSSESLLFSRATYFRS